MYFTIELYTNLDRKQNIKIMLSQTKCLYISNNNDKSFNTQRDKIISEIQNSLTDKLRQRYCELFYSYIPLDYLSEAPKAKLMEFLNESYEFITHRQDKEKIFINRHENSEGEAYLSINIITDNKPFLVDAARAGLEKYELQPHYFIHPIINLSRDASGRLQKFQNNDSEDYTNTESIIYIRVNGYYENDFINKLYETLKSGLAEVRYAYEDEEAIEDKLESLANSLTPAYEADEDAEEFKTLLDWLGDGNFHFLGATKIKYENPIKLTKSLGIIKNWDQNQKSLIKEVADKNSLAENASSPIAMGKLKVSSSIDKYEFLDYIMLKDHNSSDSATLFVGFYSSNVPLNSAFNIPVVREKINNVLELSEFTYDGHNFKELTTIIQFMPRELLFQMSTEELYIFCMHILSSTVSGKLKLFVMKDSTARFINIIIFVNQKRLTPEVSEKLDKYIQNTFNSKLEQKNLKFVKQDFTYIHYLINGEEVDLNNITTNIVEQELEQLTRKWSESFYNALVKKYGEYKAPKYYHSYLDIFLNDYSHSYNVDDALEDLDYINKIDGETNTVFNLQKRAGELHLKIYNAGCRLELSNILPLLENMGFKAYDERTYQLNTENNTCLHDFHLENFENQTHSRDFNSIKTDVEDALDKLITGKLASDNLNKLVLLQGLNWRQITIIKALARYLHQTGFSYGKGYVQLTLVKHSKFSLKLIELFEYKFNPKYNSSSKAEAILFELNNYLKEVTISAEDKVLRSFLSIFQAITRTNCYQRDRYGNYKNYLSFKFNSKEIAELPLPRPYAEIFVYSREFEAIHLRGGKVARGGIRWSDRTEDFRTEVLGLMKAQMTKNTVIVPEGSKGGFVIKFSQDNMEREEYLNRVIGCYQDFLRGMLDLTDNNIEGKVIHPDNTKILDEEDSYLVVAADKGTATFSDYANAVSEEYNFWLGDAFASGGATGYDHKKMAITAKSAWVSVERHFKEMGRDINKETFSVVGIGGMAGDVFGNGMLLSKNIKLVAAFNHRAIFLDPDPDPKASYKERLRLFKMQKATWDDFDSNVISKGGGVFLRECKQINLTPEIKSLLKTNKNQVPPDELIRMILRLDVDLLWNGGIGTYVKSTSENNIEIGDKANDNYRVNAQEVKAKIIGEGGNLGVSQRGRIEYSIAGGKINTDAVDNCGGVNCSDREVNLKIALNALVKQGRITLEKRNEVLKSMSNEISDLVLSDSERLTRSITIAERTNAFTIEMYGKLINELEKSGLLDREVEFLPSKKEIKRRSLAGEGITRPELCVLIAYSKMFVHNDLMNSKIEQEPFFDNILEHYFPQTLLDQYPEAANKHPLKKEIINTLVTNKIIDRLGPIVLERIQAETGAKLCDVARAFFSINEIFDLDQIWESIEKLDLKIDLDTQLFMFSEINKLTRRAIYWFIKNTHKPLAVSNIVERFKNEALNISKNLTEFLNISAREKLEQKYNYYTQHNVPKELASQVAKLDSLVSIFDIILVSENTGQNTRFVSTLYFEIGQNYYLDWLRQHCDKLVSDNYWNRLSIQSIKDDIYAKQREMVHILANSQTGSDSTEAALEPLKNNDKAEIYFNFINELKLQEKVDLNMMVLATKRLELMLHSLTN